MRLHTANDVRMKVRRLREGHGYIMTVEIISVGTEILLGNIVNTNAAYLAEKCAAIGLSCYYQEVVGDNEERLTGILQTALARADVVGGTRADAGRFDKGNGGKSTGKGVIPS